jgi:AraC-like DNA-binding protein
MPSSWVRTFTDADDFGAAMRTSHTVFNVTERGAYRAHLTGAVLHNLLIQRISDNRARTFHTELIADRICLAFEMQPGPARFLNGMELAPTGIIRAEGGHAYYGRSSSAGALGFISFPRSEATRASQALIGDDVPRPGEILFATPAPDALARMRRLFEATITLVEDDTGVISHLGAARGLEQALIEAMVTCIAGDLREDRAALRHHGAIMRRFHRLIEQSGDEPLYIPEVCHELGTSLRTLHNCCQEHLGMGPKRFLLLRRMHRVRQALRASEPHETTVTEVLTRYGFWQFGRFAVEYKTLFGEVPSATLARPA